MRAEDAYLFRHALVRDSAYALQPPSQRAALHLMAADLIQSLFGDAHEVAAELAEHLYIAHRGAPSTELRERTLSRTQIAAELVGRQYHYLQSAHLWKRCAELTDGAERGRLQLKEAEALQHAGRTEAADQLYRKANAALDGAELARGLCLLGGLCRETGRMQESMSSYTEAMHIAEAIADPEAECEAVGGLAIPHMETGRLEEAEALYNRALELANTPGRAQRECILRINLANLYQVTGRPEESERMYVKALKIAREIDNPRLISACIGNQAIIHFQNGDLNRATILYTEALEASRKVGDRRNEGIWLGNLAATYLEQQRMKESWELTRRSLEIAREVGDRRSEGAGLGNMANIARYEGRHEESLELHEKARQVHESISNRHFVAYTHCNRALTLVSMDRIAEANKAWKTGVEQMKELGDHHAIEKKNRVMREVCDRLGADHLESP